MDRPAAQRTTWGLQHHPSVRHAGGRPFRAALVVEPGDVRTVEPVGWRAGGLLLQFLPKSPERSRQRDLDPGDVPAGVEVEVQPEDDAWLEGRALVASVEDVELLDPNASAEQLLYRLFHQRGVRVFRSRDLHAQCSCSRERVERMLRSFSQDDRDHMVENGKITVTCEFCNSTYRFEPLDVREPTPSS